MGLNRMIRKLLMLLIIAAIPSRSQNQLAVMRYLNMLAIDGAPKQSIMQIMWTR